MSTWARYRRLGVAEMRPYIPGEDLSKVSLSEPDRQLSSEDFMAGMIARNPKNHADQWYVAPRYFAENFEPVTD